MKNGLKSLLENKEINCGLSATALRFLSLRASRIPGTHKLIGKKELFKRPQEDLIHILRQLGTEVILDDNSLQIQSWGWKPMGDTVYVSTEKSSQFASSILLNSWHLERPLNFSLRGKMVSESYWDMTQFLLRDLGMKWDRKGEHFYIFADQKINKDSVLVEMDMSSAFSLSAVAAVSGSLCLRFFPSKSLQPDFSFLEALKSMGVRIKKDEDLKVFKTEKLKGIHWSHKKTIDMFPVLCSLCALSEGESQLTEISHLKHKESDRLEKMTEILKNLKRSYEKTEKGICIKGEVPKAEEVSPFDFNCEQDHRLVMAAAIIKKAGYPINILNSEVVSKSFPKFSDIVFS